MNKLILPFRTTLLSHHLSPLSLVHLRHFTGKTESGHRFTTPKMRFKCRRPIYPPPGNNLSIPEDLTPEQFLKQIGGDTEEYAEKFENVHDIVMTKKYRLKEAGMPTQQRKYIYRIRELLKRGVITFEYLSRRTCTAPVRKE